jgi:hypothetical protein
MKGFFIAILISMFALGSAMAQDNCESKAIGKDGKPLAGAAKTSFMQKCKRDACQAKAVGSNGSAYLGNIPPQTFGSGEGFMLSRRYVGGKATVESPENGRRFISSPRGLERLSRL